MKTAAFKQSIEATPDDNTYQQIFLRKLLLLSVLGLLVQTVYLTLTGQFGIAVFNCLILVSVWTSLFTLKKDHYELAASLAIMTSLSLLVFYVMVEGLSDSTIFLFFSFPVLATFLKGKRDGSIWLMTVIVTLFILYLAGEADLIKTIDIEYSSSTFQQLIFAVFLVAMLVYFYQDNLDKKVASSVKRERELSELSAKLESEVEHRKAVGDSLNHNLQLIAQSKARTDALLQSIGEGVIAVDENGKVIMVNRVTEQLFNCLEKDVAGRPYQEIFTLYDESDNVVSEDENPLSLTLKKQSPQHASNYYYHNFNGQPVPVATTTNPVEIDGKFAGAVEVFRDITEEKAAAKTKDEFLSLASHQLRTPLAAIRWYAERLLKSTKIKDRDRDYLKTIQEDSARMNGLLSDYLNVSRLELGTAGVTVKSNLPAKIFDKVIKDLDPIIKDKELKITKKFKPGIKLDTDSRLLETIIQNLVSNAVKYTPKKGTVTVSITDYSQEGDQHGVVMNVEDTGIGIPAEQQHNIFTKLFRAQNALQSDIEGTGLGLYSASTAVQKLQGVIWFESQPKKGTHFAVKLPNLKADTINKESKENEKNE